jgi:hypothetical protein
MDNLLSKMPIHLKTGIHIWLRYIDDILLIWIGTDNELEQFMNYLNTFHPTIKFDEPEYNKDDNSC